MEKYFKIKYDKEFNDYYITPFKNGDYIWLNQIFKTKDNKLVLLTEQGVLEIKSIDYKEMRVYF